MLLVGLGERRSDISDQAVYGDDDCRVCEDDTEEELERRGRRRRFLCTFLRSRSRAARSFVNSSELASESVSRAEGYSTGEPELDEEGDDNCNGSSSSRFTGWSMGVSSSIMVFACPGRLMGFTSRVRLGGRPRFGGGMKVDGPMTWR